MSTEYWSQSSAGLTRRSGKTLAHKDWNKRLTDTISEIEQVGLPGFAGDRALIVSSLRSWLASAPLNDRQELSELMSQDDVADRPNQPGRASRRARILLACVLVTPARNDWAATVNFVNSAAGDVTIAESMAQAHDAIYSGQAKGDTNKNFLITHPKEFLEQYRVNIASKPAVEIYEYSFFMRNGEYRINPFAQVPPAAVKLHAINMPATAFSLVKDNLGAIPGVHASQFNDRPLGANLLLTTQFSGCSYCFMLSADRSSLITAHIDPEKGKGVDGAAIGKRLGAGGGFANGNGGTFRAYGRTTDKAKFGYGDGSMVVVAVRRDGVWEIWTQLTGVSGARVVERIDNSAKAHPT